MLVQGSIKLTELETSDRAKDHVVHIPSVTFPECLKLRRAVTGVVDESSHRIFSYPLLQVLKYLDYVFTGVFTFEMVIKVRKLAGGGTL